ncbi:MAG: hypothetical protein JSR82_06395 [Verrucomicrobia bacterium]|nr:hypothetical protein [Verrucomicrobiota bacterium]
MLRGLPLFLLVLWWALGPISSLPAQAPAGGLLTVEAVAADERLWPREVITKSAISVNVDGKTVTVPAGEMVRLQRVERDLVVGQFQGTTVRLPAAQTDLLAGANTRRAQLGITVQPVASAPTPATTRASPAGAPAAGTPGTSAASTPAPSAVPFSPNVRPTPRDLSAPQPTPLTPKAQTDRVVRNVIAREGIWILAMLAAAIAIAVVGKRIIDS